MLPGSVWCAFCSSHYLIVVIIIYSSCFSDEETASVILASNFTQITNDREAEWGLKVRLTPRGHGAQRPLSLFMVRASVPNNWAGGCWNQKARVQISALLLTDSMTLGQSLQFLQCGWNFCYIASLSPLPTISPRWLVMQFWKNITLGFCLCKKIQKSWEDRVLIIAIA